MIGSTADIAEFASQVEALGADVLLLYYAERYYHDDALFDYYKEISKATAMPLMIHGRAMRAAVGGGNAYYSVELCQRLHDSANVIGMKEEHGDENHRYKLGAYLGDHFYFCQAGDSMRSFFTSSTYHFDSQLVGVGSFKPEIEEKYYDHLCRDEREKALQLIKTYEDPFFALAKSMGWHIAMKGTLSLMGMYPKTERPPLQHVNSKQEEQLNEILVQFKWL